MIYENADEDTEDRFWLRLCRYQIGLETSMRGNDFIFDCIHLLYYKCYKTNQNQSGSYIDSLYWRKNKKATINLINKKDNNAFSTL